MSILQDLLHKLDDLWNVLGHAQQSTRLSHLETDGKNDQPKKSSAFRVHLLFAFIFSYSQRLHVAQKLRFIKPSQLFHVSLLQFCSFNDFVVDICYAHQAKDLEPKYLLQNALNDVHRHITPIKPRNATNHSNLVKMHIKNLEKKRERETLHDLNVLHHTPSARMCTTLNTFRSP